MATVASVACERLALSGQGRVGLISGDERLAQIVGRGRPGHQSSNHRSRNELTKHPRPLESESFRPGEAGQRRNPRIAD